MEKLTNNAATLEAIQMMTDAVCEGLAQQPVTDSRRAEVQSAVTNKYASKLRSYTKRNTYLTGRQHSKIANDIVFAVKLKFGMRNPWANLTAEQKQDQVRLMMEESANVRVRAAA